MINSWDLSKIIAVIAIILAIAATNAANTCTDSQLLRGPIIEPCLSEMILENGKNYTITCKGKSPVEFIQQEIPEDESFNLTQRYVTIEEGEYRYKTILELNNVTKYSIGYYACFDDTIELKNMNDILKSMSEEPNNTAQVSYIYIYVNGTNELFAPMREIITSRKPSKVVIECRPTTPDIEVILKDAASNKTQDTLKYSSKIGFLMRKCRAAYVCEGSLYSQNRTDMKRIRNGLPPPTPKISGGFHDFLVGESFSINCTVSFESRDIVNLAWKYPPNVDEKSIIVSTNEYGVVGGILFKNITITRATKDHAGLYICSSKNNCDEKEEKFKKILITESRLEFDTTNIKRITETNQKKYKLNIPMDAYPPPKLHLLRDNKMLPSNNKKYEVFRHESTGDAIVKISNTTVNDSANYTVVADNGYITDEVTFDLRIFGPPVVNFGPIGDKRYLENTIATLKCYVTGYPLPDITWIFSNGEEEQILVRSKVEVSSVYQMTEYLDIPIHTSGNISCKATNKKGRHIETRRLLVYEIEGGFGIKHRQNTWFSENEDVTLTCIASKYDFTSVMWIGSNGDYSDTNMQQTTNIFSLVAKLNLPNISLNQSGEYLCRGIRLDGKEQDESINITVAAIQAPVILKPAEDKTEEVYPTQHLQLNCQAEGIPPPTIEWYKDEMLLKNESKAKIITRTLNHTFVNSTIVIDQMEEKQMGTYECLAKSEGVIAKRVLTVIFKEATYTTYLIVIFAIIFVLILVVIYLALKIRKEKRLRREAGLLYFKEGAIKSLNPELGIDEQAELLPYDKKFEFPPEKLTLGKQLGAGAFGVVYKAEARGIINAEETTVVAVKMVKKTADSMYIKALASELKIMVHLGKHINIVNLLGACTKHVGKRELNVIVEYCKFGNIHNYMLRHREVFIDQLTDNKEKNLGRVNRGFSCSGSTGAHSDYFGTNNTQETDHTFVNTANTNTSVRKVSASGYVQPEWRSNYESDYSYDGRNPRPLTSRDLLAWAFQIARGMEYLASRKVLHGDLAARNILLAEDNIVKICDFGLARSIYKNDEYQKKENSLLPVKWLAIECMTDRIFSTQSDVWSFGIVLWELFSLAKTPYPNIGPADLLQWLSEGKRLAKPTYSDDRLYDVMLRCWEQKPTSRPTFSQLQEIIGGFLEDNVRNHYVDLNSAYLDMNAAPLDHEDYLAMMTAPDYNNLVTPSPHHYVNESRSFFPSTPVQLDDEGYLKMNPGNRQIIFSPRPEDNKFDFDARKLNPRVSDASTCGSELTPMLTLNNLPARSGSESDHEGNASPYITMCPTIDEETDEVFEIKQNNARNAVINSAVSNPTYTTLDFDIEKKPNDIINTYTNIPNGLVK